jgi:hypothetical protein
MKLIGTMTAPIRANANLKAANPCELRAKTATLSPGFTPMPTMPDAKRVTTASNSAYVHDVAPQTMPNLFGKRKAVRRKASAMVWRLTAGEMGGCTAFDIENSKSIR